MSKGAKIALLMLGCLSVLYALICPIAPDPAGFICGIAAIAITLLLSLRVEHGLPRFFRQALSSARPIFAGPPIVDITCCRLR